MIGNDLRRYVMNRVISGTTNSDPDKDYLNPRDSDLIIVGAAKSGTTWLQQILHQIRTKGDENFRDIYDVTWYIGRNGANSGIDLNGEQVCNPRILKHHERYGIIKKTDKQQHIVIIRDPLDCAYSYSKFVDRYFGGEDDIGDEEMAMITKKLHQAKFGMLNCLSTWWSHESDQNILFVFYEDFLKNLPFLIRKIADFIEIPLTNEEFERVVKFCSFDYMLKNIEKFKGEQGIEHMAGVLNLPKWSTNMAMIRRDGGVKGQGHKLIGPCLRRVIEEQWSETMEKEFGFKSYAEMYEQKSCLKNY